MDSTNNYAMQLVHAGVAQHAQAILAYEQTHGKGQRGKTWYSPPGESLSLTLLLQPRPLQPAQAFQLLVAVALGVHHSLEAATQKPFAIKWPNDLYWNDRKAGGILIENVVNSHNWNWALAGVGINLNQTTFDATLPHAVSLYQITQQRFDAKALALQIRYHILKELALLQQQGFANRLQAYNQQLYKRGERIRLRQQQRVFEATVEGVDAAGYLVTTQGHQFAFGEVEWLI